jgi:ubiquinone/menaquinone biosynthesis C-methylase UbiE
VAFLSRGKRRILDLACGVGRDTFFLQEQGLSVVGVDASLNGLTAACQVRQTSRATAEFVAADARHLPFADQSFDGAYCFGLLHEFVGAGRQDVVRRVMGEFARLLVAGGVLAIAALAGEPEDGLPQVQLFTRPMFDQATAGWHPLEIRCYEDVGCTNQPDYRVWYGLLEKRQERPDAVDR